MYIFMYCVSLLLMCVYIILADYICGCIYIYLYTYICTYSNVISVKMYKESKVALKNSGGELMNSASLASVSLQR